MEGLMDGEQKEGGHIHEWADKSSDTYMHIQCGNKSCIHAHYPLEEREQKLMVTWKLRFLPQSAFHSFHAGEKQREDVKRKTCSMSARQLP